MTNKPTKSPGMHISPGNFELWYSNALRFLAPLGIIYLLPIIGALSVPNHGFDIHDLVPTSYTIGAVALYVVNTAYDFLRKYIPPTQ